MEGEHERQGESRNASQCPSKHKFFLFSYLSGVNLAGDRILDFVWVSGQDSTSFDDVASESDQTGLEVALDAAGEVGGVVGNALTVEFDVPGHVDPHGGQVAFVLHLTDASGRGQQSLGGDTTPIDAGSTDVLSGEDGRLEVLCPTVQCGTVSSHTATDDGHIKVVFAIGGHVQCGRVALRRVLEQSTLLADLLDRGKSGNTRHKGKERNGCELHRRRS